MECWFLANLNPYLNKNVFNSQLKKKKMELGTM